MAKQIIIIMLPRGCPKNLRKAYENLQWKSERSTRNKHKQTTKKNNFMALLSPVTICPLNWSFEFNKSIKVEFPKVETIYKTIKAYFTNEFVQFEAPVFTGFPMLSQVFLCFPVLCLDFHMIFRCVLCGKDQGISKGSLRKATTKEKPRKN